MLSSVKLIAYTQSVDETMTMEEFIAYVARISNPENQNNRVTTKRLLKYLAREKHRSPFEMTDLVM